MTVFVPHIGGARGLHRPAPADLFWLVIKIRGAVFNGAQTGDGSGVEQQHLGQRCFAATAGADECKGALHFQWGRHGFLP